MKKIWVALTCLVSIHAMAQIKMPAASTTQTISQEFGLGKIEISYSRPNIKGRTLFTQDALLAPTGQVWRTGANASTKITFSDPVTVGGKLLPAGAYGIFTIPGKDEWVIILNTNSKGWGSFQYNEAEDVVRVKVKPETTSVSTETFTINIGNISAEHCAISLKWGNTLVQLPIATDIKPTIRKQIQDALAQNPVNPNTYGTAANFYFELDHDNNTALTMINKAIESNKSAYWLLLTKAKIQKELGDKAGAKETATACANAANEAKNQDYVRSAKELISSLK